MKLVVDFKTRARAAQAEQLEMERNERQRILQDADERESTVVRELESLRRFKDDANEVRNGTECGIGVKNYTDVKVGDLIEVFDICRSSMFMLAAPGAKLPPPGTSANFNAMTIPIALTGASPDAPHDVHI